MGNHNLCLEGDTESVKSDFKCKETMLFAQCKYSMPVIPAPVVLNFYPINRMEAISGPFTEPVIPEMLISLHIEGDRIANYFFFWKSPNFQL